MWFLIRDGQELGDWPLVLASLVGGLSLGSATPILVNVVLAGVPEHHACTAGGLLSTVHQIGAAVGIAVLGTIFFVAVDHAADGAPSPQVYGDACAAGLPSGMGLYVLAAALMVALPATTADPGPEVA